MLLRMTPYTSNHPDRLVSLHHLGRSLQLRFQRTAEVPYLAKAIMVLNEAVEHTQTVIANVGSR
jgi:hypothetical protein